MNQTDPRAVATIDGDEFYDLCQTYRHMPIENQEAVCSAFSALTAYVDDALADAERRGLERAAKEVPTNWCDPLLTGPKGIAKADTAFTCRSIEQLLRGIQGRIRAQAQADKVEP